MTEQFLRCLIFLMREEIDCLRSVLSEFEGDKSEYVQMNRADDIQRVREGMEHRL